MFAPAPSGAEVEIHGADVVNLNPKPLMPTVVQEWDYTVPTVPDPLTKPQMAEMVRLSPYFWGS